jgi:predicted PurR-regulated permease PerM
MWQRDRLFYYLCFCFALVVLYPIWTPLITGMVLAYLCESPFSWLLKRLGPRTEVKQWAVAFVVVTLVQISFIAPLLMLATTALQELAGLVKLMDDDTAASAAAAAMAAWTRAMQWSQGMISEFLLRFDMSFSLPDLTARWRGLVEPGLRKLAGGFASAIGSTPQVAVFFFVSWISWIYFLAVGSGGRGLLLKHLIPWEKQRLLIGQTLGGVLRNMVLTSIILALAQSLLVTLALGLTGVPKFYLWGSLSFFLSFVPVFGTFPVMLAGAIYFFFNDEIVRAVILIGVSVAIGLSDNVLRPLLMRGGSSLSFFWLFLSLLGGVAVFGIPGAIIGPWALTLFLAVQADAENSQVEVQSGSDSTEPTLAR